MTFKNTGSAVTSPSRPWPADRTANELCEQSAAAQRGRLRQSRCVDAPMGVAKIDRRQLHQLTGTPRPHALRNWNFESTSLQRRVRKPGPTPSTPGRGRIRQTFRPGNWPDQRRHPYHAKPAQGNRQNQPAVRRPDIAGENLSKRDRPARQKPRLARARVVHTGWSRVSPETFPQAELFGR